jgi:hypothetical protein
MADHGALASACDRVRLDTLTARTPRLTAAAAIAEPGGGTNPPARRGDPAA